MGFSVQARGAGRRGDSDLLGCLVSIERLVWESSVGLWSRGGWWLGGALSFVAEGNGEKERKVRPRERG